MTPLVSIVIPTYNRARDLERALKSVFAQTYSQWEILVVDNHSSDNTDNLVRSFGDTRIKLLKIHNLGVIAASRNLGIKHSQGEYIAFLDSDDWWSPQKLEESFSHLERGADVVYHDMFLVNKTDQQIIWRKDRARALRIPVFADLIINGNALKTSSVVLRKRLLQEIGGLSEDADLVAMEDFDTWLRVARITEKFARIPKTLGYYWNGGGKITSPAITLKILDAFEKRYANDIGNLVMGSGFWWFHYSIGRAHYLLGYHSKAKKALEKISWKQVPFLVVVKTIWMRLIIGLFHDTRLGST